MTIIIPGKPVPQGRPRTTVRGGRAIIYDPPTSREWKQNAQKIMRAAVDGNLPIPAGVPVMVDILAAYPWPRGKRPEDAFHTKRGDVDNIAKIVLDAANGVLWEDDGQVVALSICKLYSDDPRVELDFRGV